MKRGFATYLMTSVAALINLSAVVCVLAVLFPVQQASATYADHQTKRFSQSVPALKAELDAAIALMKRNGIYQAVNGDPLLIALAFHESGGRLGATNYSEKGYALCAFQIYNSYKDNFQKMAAQNNMSVAQFTDQILRDPELCAAMGREILNYMVGRYGRDKGICRYFGQITELRETDTCAGLKEINITLDIMGEALIGDTNVDIESPDFSRQELEGPLTGRQTVLNCQEDTFNFSQALAKASEAGKANKEAYAEEKFYKDIYQDTLGGESGLPMHGLGFQNLRGDVRTTYCINMVFDYFQLIRLLLPIDLYGVSLLMNMILETLLDYLCRFVANSVNNLLGQVCLPTVKLFNSLSLEGGFGTTSSCDGASLADLIAVSSNASMAAAGSASGRTTLPPIDALPAQTPDAPALGLRMRLPTVDPGTP